MLHHVLVHQGVVERTLREIGRVDVAEAQFAGGAELPVGALEFGEGQIDAAVDRAGAVAAEAFDAGIIAEKPEEGNQDQHGDNNHQPALVGAHEVHHHARTLVAAGRFSSGKAEGRGGRWG